MPVNSRQPKTGKGQNALKYGTQGAMAGSMFGPYGTVIGGVAGAAYGAFGNPQEEQQDQSRVWNEDYLRQLYDQAGDVYNQTKTMGADESALYDQANQYYGPNGPANQNMMGLMDTGKGMTELGQKGVTDYMNRSPEQIQYNYGNIDQAINNDILQNQINASTSGMYRDLRENQLTGTLAQGAANGTVGGSRGHQMESILTRGALDNATNIAAQMRGQAYNMAYGAETQRATNQANMNQNLYGQQGQMGYNLLGSGTQLQMNAGNQYGQNLQQGIGLANQRRMDPWNSMKQYAGILGGPTQIGVNYQNPNDQAIGYGFNAMSAIGDSWSGSGGGNDYYGDNYGQ